MVNWSVACVIYPFHFTGITNHEEYSLIVELPEDEKEKTLTLKRDKSIAKDQKKLEELRKKLHTEDDSKFNQPFTIGISGIDPERVS
jgi:talin